MFLLINFGILIGACILIFKTTEWFVRGTVDLAAVLRLPKVFIGITLVSLVTTAPELIVSITSSYLGESGLAVGNVLGSCICNIGLAFAAGAMLRDIVVHKDDFKYKIIFLVCIIFILFIFIANGLISRFEAGILLVLFAIFITQNYKIAIKAREEIPAIAEPDKKSVRLKKGILYFLCGGIGTVLLARYGMVYTGINIATALKMPPIILGLSLIAIGTSLPELFTAIISSRQGHSEIALGNIIGANTLNLLLVLGASSMVNPLSIDKQTLFFTMPALLILTLLMILLGFKDKKYSRREGAILLTFYILYLVVLFTVLY